MNTFEKPNILISVGFYLIRSSVNSVFFLRLFDVCSVSFFCLFYTIRFFVTFQELFSRNCSLPTFKYKTTFFEVVKLFIVHLNYSHIYSICTALYRTQLPVHRNLFNGCQGHPPLCLPPGTAQRLPDRIQKVFGRAANLFS